MNKQIVGRPDRKIEQAILKLVLQNSITFSLENELYICKSELGNCQMELESVKNSNIQLTEENSALQMSSKNSMSESQSLMAEMQMIKDTGRGKHISYVSQANDKIFYCIHYYFSTNHAAILIDRKQ